MDSALRDYPEIVQKYLGTVIPPGDNKFAALNSAVWSGGSFIYVPPGVHVDMPLQAYFRINAENAGQFERTLIIADEGSSVHYVEGCSAPVYSSDSLHSAVVELIAKPGARIRYTTIQNWSPNVYNLVTKRARAETEADRRVDRRQPRLEAHDEVPGRGDDRPEGARRGALGRVRGSRASIRTRGEDDPRRARDHVDHRLEVDLEGRWPHHVPRPRAGGGRRVRREEPRALRRAHPRRREPLRHLSVHGDRRARRTRRSRGHRVEGRRRPALLPDEPRARPSSRPPR